MLEPPTSASGASENRPERRGHGRTSGVWNLLDKHNCGVGIVRNKAYHIAEEKIQAALRSGETELKLNARSEAKEDERLTELPESLFKLIQLRWLDLSSE